MFSFIGSLLLLVNNYANSDGRNLIPHTALGILLLIIALLLAYAGRPYCLIHVQPLSLFTKRFLLKLIPLSFQLSPPGVCCSLQPGQLFSALSLTISALWCGSGLVYILLGQGLLQPTELRSALIPGLAAFTLALLVMSGVAVAAKKTVLFLVALGISLACAHQIASLSVAGFGQSATAVCYLVVCLVCFYFGSGRLLSTVSHGRVSLPGTGLKDKTTVLSAGSRSVCNDAVSVGLVMNLLSASVLVCPLLGVVPQLFVGHVPWLWTAGLFQLAVVVLSYRAMDALAATFYGFTALLRFAEGYSALLTFYSIQPSSTVPFPVVFAVLFSILALFTCEKGLLEGIYQLFFVAYCIAIAAQPQGFFQGGTQGVQGAIFVVSACMLVITTFNMVSTRMIPTGKGYFKAVVTKMRLTLKVPSKELHDPYLGYSKYVDAEVLGHACSVLAAFAITASLGGRDPLSVLVLPWVVVAGGVLQLLCGSVAFSRGKTFESTVFILYGVMWTVWGLTRYGGLYGQTRGFNIAVGIIGFLLFNSLVTIAALFLSVTWFAYTLSFQLIIISFLLDAVGSLPYGYDIGVTIIFGLISFYCFLSHIFNSSFESPQIPLGKPLIKLGGIGGGADVCPHLPANKATSVQQIAGKNQLQKSESIWGKTTNGLSSLNFLLSVFGSSSTFRNHEKWRYMRNAH